MSWLSVGVLVCVDGRRLVGGLLVAVLCVAGCGGAARLLLGALVGVVGLLDGALELGERRRQVRPGELLQRFARMVIVGSPAGRGAALARGQHELACMLLGGEHDERATVDLAFLVLRTVGAMVRGGFALVSTGTVVARSGWRGRQGRGTKETIKVAGGPMGLAPVGVSRRLRWDVRLSSRWRVRAEHDARFRRIVEVYLERPGGDYAELLRRGLVSSPEGVDPEVWRAEIRAKARADKIRVNTVRDGERAMAFRQRKIPEDQELAELNREVARGQVLQGLAARARELGHEIRAWLRDDQESIASCTRCPARIYARFDAPTPVVDGEALQDRCRAG